MLARQRDDEAARRRREEERLEAAAQERRRSFLARLEHSFEHAFLEADARRASDADGALISDVEYDDLKARFVQRWARSALGLKLDADQAAAVSSVGTDTQVVARAGSGKTRTLVARALFHRVACVNQVQKADAFDHAATINIQTGNDSFG